MKEGLEQAWLDSQGGQPAQETEQPVQEINEIADAVEEVNPPQEESVPQQEVEATGSLETIVEETPVLENPAPARNLPENVDKLVDFLNENPSADLQDYINLNKSFDDFEEKALLSEFYSKTKPHLDEEDISYLINEKFDFDAEDDSNRGKQISLKEELSKAKSFLNQQKDKYYADLKVSGGSAANQEFAQQAEKATQHFLNETEKVFEGLDSFTFDIGDKKLKYNLQDPNVIKEKQSDLNNLINRFVNEDGLMTDALGYHKALYAAANADKLAKMFYERGVADAVENAATSSKNIDFTHQHRPATSNTKLQPGQAREITNNTTNSPRVNIKWNK